MGPKNPSGRARRAEQGAHGHGESRRAAVWREGRLRGREGGPRGQGAGRARPRLAGECRRAEFRQRVPASGRPHRTDRAGTRGAASAQAAPKAAPKGSRSLLPRSDWSNNSGAGPKGSRFSRLGAHRPYTAGRERLSPPTPTHQECSSPCESFRGRLSWDKGIGTSIRSTVPARRPPLEPS